MCNRYILVSFSKSRYTVFKTRYQKKWKRCLPFRPKCDFAECNQCFDIKQEIKSEKAGKLFVVGFSGLPINRISYLIAEPETIARTPQFQDLCKKFGLVREYKDHLRAVGFDRELEQHLEGLDPHSSDAPILLLQFDGMDQAKWALPRFPENRGSKALQQFVRPRLKVVGVWASRYLLTLYLIDANIAHDASLTVEAVRTKLKVKPNLTSPQNPFKPFVIQPLPHRCCREASRTSWSIVTGMAFGGQSS